MQTTTRIKVMKFGGTSVATPEARAQSAMRVIQAREQGFQPVVVVSAIGRRGAPYATDTLIGELRGVDPEVDPDERELDMIAACGEILSAVIFAQTLKSAGQPAMSFRGGQAGIRTDGVYGNARITSINPVGLEKAIGQGYIPVICGFQGVHVGPDALPGSELTTLGRGGSDTTAAAIGAALNACAVEIFTDVDGVKTADPDCVPNAPTLRKVSYEEVAEIAHLGAKVLHPRAAEIAMRNGTPLWVKSTFSDDPGTEIVEDSTVEGRTVTGVTHSGKLVYLQFDFKDIQADHRAILERTIYEMTDEYGFSLFMITRSPSSVAFAIPRDQLSTAEDLLDGLVIPLGNDAMKVYMVQMGLTPSREAEIQAKLLSSLGETHRISLSLTEGCTMVSLVGSEFRPIPGVFHRVLSCLHRNQVSVFQTADSDLSMSVLIPEADMPKAVRCLHTEFGLGDLT